MRNRKKDMQVCSTWCVFLGEFWLLRRSRVLTTALAALPCART